MPGTFSKDCPDIISYMNFNEVTGWHMSYSFEWLYQPEIDKQIQQGWYI